MKSCSVSGCGRLIRRLLEWFIGRSEPHPDLVSKEQRLTILETRVRVITGGKRR